MVWRIGGVLLEIPQLPSCVGVASHGLDLGVLNPVPQLILGPLRDSTCLSEMLAGLVRATLTVTAPNALWHQTSQCTIPSAWLIPGLFEDPT